MNQIRTPLLTPLMHWFLFAMILANIAGGMITILPIWLKFKLPDRQAAEAAPAPRSV